MSVDTNWDIEYYKTDYESEEHWNLRKRFMEIHKPKFEEDELVCLAQVFTNVEFMGCRYPDETMQLIGHLSQEVAEDFRKNRASRLKRTFVKASDAAEARAKGLSTLTIEHNSNNNSEKQQKKKKKIKPKSLLDGEKAKDHSLFKNLPYGHYTLIIRNEEKVRDTIRYSANQCLLPVELKTSNVDDGPKFEKKAEVFVDSKLVATGIATTIKEATSAAYKAALKELKKECYCIYPNSNADKIVIKKNKDTYDPNVGFSTSKAETGASSKIDQDNIGYKMLQKQGWSGGGLGSKTQGIKEPIEVSARNKRTGLGNTTTLNKKYFEEMFSNYSKSPEIRELAFNSTFTKQDRAELHKIACRFNLKSLGRGIKDRYLAVNKKLTVLEILEEYLINKNLMYLHKYEVKIPRSKASEFPEQPCNRF